MDGRLLIEQSPMGPGWFIFFQTGGTGGPSGREVDRRKIEDDEVMELMIAIIGVIDEPC